MPTFVFNPLQTNPDKVDAKTVALMLATESSDNAYSFQPYQNEELKSLTRYRFDKVNQRSKLKQSLSRPVTILFPELESAVFNDVAKSQLHFR